MHVRVPVRKDTMAQLQAQRQTRAVESAPPAPKVRLQASPSARSVSRDPFKMNWVKPRVRLVPPVALATPTTRLRASRVQGGDTRAVERPPALSATLGIMALDLRPPEPVADSAKPGGTEVVVQQAAPVQVHVRLVVMEAQVRRIRNALDLAAPDTTVVEEAIRTCVKESVRLEDMEAVVPQAVRAPGNVRPAVMEAWVRPIRNAPGPVVPDTTGVEEATRTYVKENVRLEDMEAVVRQAVPAPVHVRPVVMELQARPICNVQENALLDGMVIWGKLRLSAQARAQLGSPVRQDPIRALIATRESIAPRAPARVHRAPRARIVKRVRLLETRAQTALLGGIPRLLAPHARYVHRESTLLERAQLPEVVRTVRLVVTGLEEVQHPNAMANVQQVVGEDKAVQHPSARDRVLQVVGEAKVKLPPSAKGPAKRVITAWAGLPATFAAVNVIPDITVQQQD